MGGGSSTEEKKEEPTTNTTTQMTENSSGFHILEIHMPSLGTGMGILLLVRAAVLALRWWFQRRHAKELWQQGGFPGQAFKMGCWCHPRCPYLPPAGPSWTLGGEETGGRFDELLSGAVAPPSPAHCATRAVGWPRHRPWGMRTTWREGPPLSAAVGKEDEVIVHYVVVKKKL